MASESIFGSDAALVRNSNSDVPGKYSDTYFRIGGNGYDGSGGNPWPEHIQAVYEDEVREILIAQGWTVIGSKRSGSASTTTKDRNYLYLHPQSFSGVCENKERKTLFEAFKAAKTFVCRRVDVYDEIHDMTDIQLSELLQSKREAIKFELLEAFTTKRRNLYFADVGFFGVDGKVAKRHSLKRLAIDGKKSYDGVDECSDGICHTFVSGIFQELVSAGKIVTAQTKSGKGYRTAKNSDLIKKTA